MRDARSVRLYHRYNDHFTIQRIVDMQRLYGWVQHRWPLHDPRWVMDKVFASERVQL